MKRLLAGHAGVALVLAVCAAPALAADSATVATSENEEYGSYLVDGEGQSLYLFEADSEGKSTCYDACAQAWPPLLSEGSPQAGGEASAEHLGTIERRDGSQQVTYNGHPLYHFVKDSQSGDTKGQDVEGFGAEWYLVTPDGEKAGH